MSTRLIAATIMSAVLLLVVLFLLALRGCESPSTEPEEPIQYPNHEETTAPLEGTQYPSELPGTGGVEVW